MEVEGVVVIFSEVALLVLNDIVVDALVVEVLDTESVVAASSIVSI